MSLSSEVLYDAIRELEKETGGRSLQPILLEPIVPRPLQGWSAQLLVSDLKAILGAADEAEALRGTIKGLKEERAEVNETVVDIGKEVDDLKATMNNLGSVLVSGGGEVTYLTPDNKEKINNIIKQIKDLLTEIYDGSQSTM